MTMAAQILSGRRQQNWLPVNVRGIDIRIEPAQNERRVCA
jgi:hypothetical protein